MHSDTSMIFSPPHNNSKSQSFKKDAFINHMRGHQRKVNPCFMTSRLNSLIELYWILRF